MSNVRLGEVLKTEGEEIHRRRRVAGVFPSQEGDQPSQEGDQPSQEGYQPPDKLVGLALSGGGLRSAIFNLGLLQAFSHRGLLKYVDYLSSVSGGGYIAGHLAVKATQHSQIRRPENPQSYHKLPASNLGIDPKSGKRLKDYQFLNAGGYLHDWTGWLGGWFGGTIVTVLFFFTAFCTAATLIALYWRSVDSSWFRARAGVLGIGVAADELEWAFLPALPILCLWMGVLAARWIGRWFGRGSGDWTLNIWGLLALWLALVPVLRMSGLNGRSAATVALWLALIPTVLPVTPGIWQRFFLGLGALAVGTLAVTGLLPLFFSPLSVDLSIAWYFPFARDISIVLMVLLAFSIPIVFVRGYVASHNIDPDPYRYPCRWMTIAALTAVGISIAVFLGNGVTQITGSTDRYDQNFSLPSTGVWLAVATALAQLIALLGIRHLFQSEISSTSSWRKIAFNVVISSVIVIPLFAIAHWMAEENISGFATYRDPDLLATDIRDWKTFSEAIETIPTFTKILNERHVSLDHDLQSRFEGLQRRSESRVNPREMAAENTPPVKSSNTLWQWLLATNDALLHTTNEINGDTDWKQRERRLTTLPGALERFQLVYLGDLYGDESHGPDRYTEYLTAQEVADKVRRQIANALNGSTTGNASATAGQGLASTALTDDLLQLLLKDIKDVDGRPQTASESVDAAGLSTSVMGEGLSHLLIGFEGDIEALIERFVTPIRTNIMLSSYSISSIVLPAAIYNWLRGRVAELIKTLVTPTTTSISLPPSSISHIILPAADRAVIDRWLKDRAADPKDRFMQFEGGTFLNLWDRYVIAEPASADAISYLDTGGDNTSSRPIPPNDLRRLNRLLLECLYPDSPYVMLLPRRKASTNTVAAMDQTYRAWWLVVWTGGFVVLLLIVFDFNRLSPSFRFYRDALERHFLRRDRESVVHPLLSRLRTCDSGMPYHLFGGCLMIRRCGTSETATEEFRDYEHPEVDHFPFTFSQGYCSIGYSRDRVDACESKRYAGGGLQLADAVTVSGSAVSPYWTRNPWLTWFMSAFNIRLGMWLSNPGHRPAEQLAGAAQPELRIAATPWSILKEWNKGFWRNDPADWNLGFVADGGFRENLGVEALLIRQCALIVASDAGNNGGKDQFSSLANLVQLARSEYGIKFYDLDHDHPIDLDRFRRDAELQVPQQILCLRVHYPDRMTVDENGNISREEKPWYGLMIYLQMSMTGLEDVDLQQIRKRLPNFPDEPTTNQFYTKEQVEAYRMLGYHIGNIACRDLPVRDLPDRDLPDRDRKIDFEELTARLKMSYLWECRREHARRADDVSVEALFDLEAAGLTLPEESAFKMEDKSAEDWLERYYRDADFRLFQRRRVCWLLEGKQDEARRASKLCNRPRGFRNWNDEQAQKWLAQATGQLIVLAVACHELASARKGGEGRQDDANATAETQGGRVATDVFLIGGRERFLKLAKESLMTCPTEPADDLLTDIHASKWTGARDRFVSEIRRSVFATHPRETTDAFVDCLLNFELREDSYFSSTTKQPTREDTKPITRSHLIEEVCAKLAKGSRRPIADAIKKIEYDAIVEKHNKQVQVEEDLIKHWPINVRMMRSQGP